METNHQDYAESWRNIDQQTEADIFVSVMDRMNAVGFFRQLKARCIDLLEAAEGHRVLDVGCGTGNEVRALARIVGPSGRAVGIDSSQVMLDEARRRSINPDLAVEYHSGDAAQLAFEDSSFDRCCSFGMLEVAADPRRALAEMARVTRRGGRVVVPAFDLDTIITDSSFRDLTRKMISHYSDTCNGWLGRQLPGIFRELGLVDLVITPTTLLITDFDLMRELWLPLMVEDARQGAVASDSEIDDWIADCEARDRKGSFLCAATAIIVCGHKA